MSEHDSHSTNHPICCIIPPVILRNLAEKGDEKQRDLAFRAIQISASIRGKREAIGSFAFAAYARADLYCPERQIALFFVAFLGQITQYDRRDDATNGMVR